MAGRAPLRTSRGEIIDNFFGTALVFNALGLVSANGLLVARLRLRPLARWRDWWAALLVPAAACVGTLLHRGVDRWLLAFTVAGAVVVVVVRRLWPALHTPGVLALVVQGSTLVAGTIWIVHYTLTVDVGPTTRTLLVASIVLGLPTLPFGLVTTFLPAQVLYRDTWNRPNTTHKPLMFDGPKVSIHVPCYAEPPDVVIGTLDALAELRYEDFEVIVVDNNTKDPALWRPVEEHCRTLGPRFRFFHVDPLPGAKGGALNFALAHTDPDAELVALVDADYQMLPDFLASLVGHFENPALGFVQCRYDFRGWENRRFETGCYWGYRAAFPTMYRSANDVVAAIPMGTSCMLRRQAIVAAGGWSEWCVTEDSELGVRIHALGYTSYNFDETYGYGLVPETFRDFKKQRFRWTYGPVQQLKQHWRLYLPRPFGEPSQLSPSQKLLHLVHGFALMLTAVRVTLMAPLGMALLASMVAYHERPPVPAAMWFAMAVGTAAYGATRWALFRQVVGVPARGVLATGIVHAGLTYTYTMASLAGVFTRNTAWRRTNKFKARASGWQVLATVRPELVLAVGTLTVGLAAFAVDHSGLFLVLEVAAMRRSLVYFAAVAAAVQAERDLRRPASEKLAPVHPPRPVVVPVTPAHAVAE